MFIFVIILIVLVSKVAGIKGLLYMLSGVTIIALGIAAFKFYSMSPNYKARNAEKTDVYVYEVMENSTWQYKDKAAQSIREMLYSLHGTETLNGMFIFRKMTGNMMITLFVRLKEIERTWKSLII